MSSANGLDKPPPGWVWTQAGRNLSLVNTGDPDFQRHEAEHRANIEAAKAHAAERLAEAERDRLISARVAEAVAECPPECRVAGHPPARAALLETLAFIDRAKRQALAAGDRLQSVTLAVARRDAARTALAALDASVDGAHREWIRYGSHSLHPPDPRSAERAGLRDELDAHATVAALASDAEFEVEVARSVIEELSARLPGLRCAVLQESCQPICLEIERLSEQIEDAYGVLCSLATVISSGPKAVKAALPSMPYGTAAIEVSANDLPAQVDAWRKALAALAEDPNALVEVPGAEPIPEPPPPVSFVRSAVRQLISR